MADPFDFSGLATKAKDPFDFSGLAPKKDPFDFSALTPKPPARAPGAGEVSFHGARMPPQKPQESGALRGFREGFGSEPIGLSDENAGRLRKMGIFPMLEPEIRAGAAPIDLINRLFGGAAGAVAGAAGGIAKSPALERDVRAGLQVAPAAEMGAGMPHLPLEDPRAKIAGPEAVKAELEKPSAPEAAKPADPFDFSKLPKEPTVEQPLPTYPGTVTHPKPNITSVEGAKEVPAPPDALAKAQAEAPLRERIQDAYLKVTGGKFSTRATLDKIRAELPDVDKATLDKELFQMHLQPGAKLMTLDNPPERTPERKAAAVDIAGEPMHLLWMDKPTNKSPSANLLSAAAPPAPGKLIGAPGPALGGPAAIPGAPTRGYISKLSDQLYTHDRTGDADKIELQKWVESLPKEVVDLDKKFFEYREPGGKKPILTDEEKAAFDKYQKPLIEEERDLYEEIKKLAPDMMPGDYDPDYVHHMVKGRVPEFDVPLGEVKPEEGLPYQSKLPQTTRSLKASRYYALDDGSGHRQVVMLDDKGNLSLMQNQKPISIPPKDITFPAGGTDVKPGESLKIGGKEWKISRASVAEKEEATPYRYHKSSFAATIGNLVRLRKVSRAVKWFDNLKTSPEWANYAQRMQPNKTLPKGWREPRMPLFRGWAVDAHLADLIDDYYGQRGPIEERLAKVNQAIVGTLFWQPITHAVNVAAHWTVGRGWDWLNVPQWAGYARDMASAVRDVAQQGPITQALLKEGSAQMLPRVLNREFYSKVLKALGEDLKTNAKYDSMFKTLGVKPLEFYQAWMKKSNEALWYLNDVFMTHRVLELKRKGMSTSQAIKEAEKHIPNYRLPPRVMNSRMISRYMGSGAASEFGRFHYNVWNSYAHMARDLVKGSGKERVDALGHVMALGVLGMLVWPAVSAGIAKLTGNPRDRASPRGPLSVMQDARDVATMLAPETTAKIGMSLSERNFGQIIQNVIGLAPMWNQAATQLTGHNPYTNQAVSTTGERAQAAADSFQPSQILTDLWSGRMNVPEEALKSTIGIQRAKGPTPPQVIKQQMRTQLKNTGKQPIDAFVTWIEQEMRKAGVNP